MTPPLVYASGVEIRLGDRVLLYGEPGEIELVLDGVNNPADWPAQEYGRGIMVREPKVLGRLFIEEASTIRGVSIKEQDLEFVARSI